MLKIAKLEQEISNLDKSGTDEDTLAAAALDFAAYDTDDLRRVASLVAGFADALDADGHRIAADRLDRVLSKFASNPEAFWDPPKRRSTEMLPPNRSALGDIGASLSTRHSPDLPGVQLARVSDGVYRDPVTDKIYDFNKGFVLDDGTKYVGGSVSAQTPAGSERFRPLRQQIEFGK
jgi:hypothetical protein